MGFSKQKYWHGLPFPPPGDRPHPGNESISLVSHALQVDSLPLSHLAGEANKKGSRYEFFIAKVLLNRN